MYSVSCLCIIYSIGTSSICVGDFVNLYTGNYAVLQLMYVSTTFVLFSGLNEQNIYP